MSESVPRAIQLLRLGRALDYLSGIATVSMIQAGSLAAFPMLMRNLANDRFAVPRVIDAVRTLLASLENLELTQSLTAAEPYRPMLQQMVDYMAQGPAPRSTVLLDPFADRLAGLAVELGPLVEAELGQREGS